MKSTSLLLTVLTFGLGRGLAADALPEASELFNRCFAQIGGREKLAATTAAIVTGKVEQDGASSDFTLQVKSPGMALLTIRDAKGRVVRQGRDPRAHFWLQDSKGVRDLEEKAVNDLVSMGFVFHPAGLVNLSERLGDAVCEADLAGGRPAYVIGRKKSPGLFLRVLFDAQTGLLIGMGHTRFSDYREVTNGVKVPFTVRDVQCTYRVASVQFDNSLPEKGFEPAFSKGGPMVPGFVKIAGVPPASTRLAAPGRLEIVRRPQPVKRGKGELVKLPVYNPVSGRHAQVDLVTADVRRLDLQDRLPDLLHADFNTKTLWPARLPAGFEPQKILDLGKDPGLGLRRLHAQGITGKGIGIGIIDFPLLTEHTEYADHLKLYEEIEYPDGAPAHMHGAGVSSLALGRTCGVAPGADLYFIATSNNRSDGKGGDIEWSSVARALNRLLDVNASLPASNKIRVVSLSMGWGRGESGYEKMVDAVNRAKEQNVFVISSALRWTYGLEFDGLNRAALADPNDFQNYGPGSWWATRFWSGEMRFKSGKRLCVPMDGRTTASPTGPNEYTHFDNAGWSWSVPWIAGLYVLACEVCPEITPEQFWAEALKTGRTIELQHAGETIPFGTIADPCALIAALRTLEP
jgi:hypothetical protein